MRGLLPLYRGAGRVFELAAPLWLKRRAAHRKEDPARLTERLGQFSLPRPDGPLIWVHAASVGETVSVLPLLSALQSARPDVQILLTTVTTTAARIATERLPDGILHQYAPIDTPKAVARFLTHWQPSALLLIESELWPNMIVNAKAAGARIAVINGRLSDKSFQNWQRFGAGRTLMDNIDLVLAQGPEQAEQFRILGAENIATPGNLKWAGTPLPVNEMKLTDLQEQLGSRPCWLAASTHEGEERQVADAHIALRQEYNHDHLLTIIVPRHPERGPSIADDLTAMGLTVSLRSRQDLIKPETDAYIADTLGELGTFYALTDLVFMGGSLVPKGGHNPLEAARSRCCIITGEHQYDFKSIYNELLKSNAAISLTGSRGLAFWINLALADPALREATGNRAKELVDQHKNVLPDTLDALLPLLPED